MIRWPLLFLSVWMFALSATAMDASGFNKRFQLVKDTQGKTIAVRLKTISGFSLVPYFAQIKNDVLEEQRYWRGKSASEREIMAEQRMLEMGLNPHLKDGSDEQESNEAIKEALINLPDVKVEESFQLIQDGGLFQEFEARIKEALLQLDLSVVANLEDPRFFYRHNVTYQVVEWALKQAQKRFASVPLLNLASFVIVKVNDLLLEQKTFHHNMLLHYCQVFPEGELGMTKDEVDRVVSSIYEYRIQAMSYGESNSAARDWAHYGWNKFYTQLRQGNTRARNLDGSVFRDQSRLDFAFSEFNEGGSRKIYHLLVNAHMFSGDPALAYDYGAPNKVKRMRSLISIGQFALGFVPMIPGWIKDMAHSFLNSMHKDQRHLEGALVPLFEMQGRSDMVNAIYKQNINPYIVR